MSMAFVADGCDRARTALHVVIRKEVTAEYSARLAAAHWTQRAAMRQAIDAEVERRITEKAPFDALY